MNFSVVVPTRNRTQQVAQCLESFSQLVYPAGQWELIVVNDGGEAWQTAVSPNLLAALPLQTLSIPPSGPAAARNAGARLARGRYLAFTDDDCQVLPDWLTRLEEGFSQTAADALGGQTVNPAPNHSAAQAGQILIDFLYLYLRDGNGRPTLLVSNNAAYRRSVFWRSGGFDESFPRAAAEDWELGLRMSEQGYTLAAWPAAQLVHHHRLSWLEHCRQQFRYGRGGHLLARRRKGLPSNYARKRFSLALAQYLRQNQISPHIWVIIGLGQLAYRLGKFTEMCNY